MTEVFTVTAGSFNFGLDHQALVLSVGESLVVPPNTIHSFKSREVGSKIELIFNNCLNREKFFIQLIEYGSPQFSLTKIEWELFKNAYDQYASEYLEL